GRAARRNLTPRSPNSLPALARGSCIPQRPHLSPSRVRSPALPKRQAGVIRTRVIRLTLLLRSWHARKRRHVPAPQHALLTLPAFRSCGAALRLERRTLVAERGRAAPGPLAVRP